MMTSCSLMRTIYSFNASTAPWSDAVCVLKLRLVTNKNPAYSESGGVSEGRCGGLIQRGLLEYPDVVHGHESWEWRGFVGVTGPLSTYSHVHDKEERVVEGVGHAIHVLRCDGVIVHVVQVELDFIFLPIDGEHMEFIGKGLRKTEQTNFLFRLEI